MSSGRAVRTLLVFLIVAPPAGMLMAGAIATMLLPTITMHAAVTPWRLALFNLPQAWPYGAGQALVTGIAAAIATRRGAPVWPWTLIAAAATGLAFAAWMHLFDPSGAAIMVAHLAAAAACLCICRALDSR
jgi:hypothetical protein